MIKTQQSIQHLTTPKSVSSPSRSTTPSPSSSADVEMATTIDLHFADDVVNPQRRGFMSGIGGETLGFRLYRTSPRELPSLLRGCCFSIGLSNSTFCSGCWAASSTISISNFWLRLWLSCLISKTQSRVILGLGSEGPMAKSQDQCSSFAVHLMDYARAPLPLSILTLFSTG